MQPNGRETADRGLEIQALNGLGETLLALGRGRGAVERHAAALAVARETGDRHKQARAHDGLAAALPDPGTHREQAMTIYRDLDVPEARA